MEYFSIIKRTEVLRATITGMNFTSVMVSERSQILKATYFIIPFISHSGKGKTKRTENR